MTSEERNTEENNMLRAPPMSFVRYFQSYYRRNLRSLGTSDTRSRNLDVAPRYRGQCLLEHGSFQHDSAVTSRNIGVPRANPGSAPPTPPSGGSSIFNWIKLAIGSVFTLLLPFLYSQWKNILKIGGELETAKEVVEKTAEAVEKIAEMAEKTSEEAAEQLKDGKLKEAVEFVEHISEEVEEDARIVDDIIHKVDEIEEDVKDLIEPNKNDDGNNEHNENKSQDKHEESNTQDNLS